MIALLPACAGQPTSETELRDAVQSAEKLVKELRTDLKNYHEHLLTALYRLGYTQYHPLFRTNLDGFSANEIDLEALDEYKMGRMAFDLLSEGTQLTPDPFSDWAAVQRCMESFQKRVDSARRVVARADVLDASSAGNISSTTYRRLQSRWRAAILGAADLYDHARAIRAVKFENGVMVAAEPNVRAIPGVGPYAVPCVFKTCASGK